MKQVILGSQSPRRHELLKKINIPFSILISHGAEEINYERSPHDNIKRLALEKLNWLRNNHPIEVQNKWIICADTLVYRKKSIFGKPKSLKEAEEMLSELSSRWHRVGTAIAIGTPSGNTISDFAETKVQFRKLDREQIQFYLSLNESMDAAGAYKIQEAGDILIKCIKGSFSNVMGLPISLLYEMLCQNAYPWDE